MPVEGFEARIESFWLLIDVARSLPYVAHDDPEKVAKLRAVECLHHAAEHCWRLAPR